MKLKAKLINQSNFFYKSFKNHQEMVSRAINLIPEIEKIYKILLNTVRNKGTIFIIGNGGSAADSQHIAAELIGRFKFDRKPIKAIALTTDSSILTALSNDYNYNIVFKRQIEALSEKKDLLIAISTSGNSKNIIEALKFAKKRGIKRVCLLGKNGGLAKKYAQRAIIIPSKDTARIQEAHILINHMLCEKLEKDLYRK